MRMIRLGFSTGALYNTGIPINERIGFFKKLGCPAIELGYTKEARLAREPLEELDPNLLQDFFWVSLHAPGGDWKIRNDESTREVLKKIQDFHDRRPLNLVIFHPDSFEDFSVMKRFSFPVAIENMDARKFSFQRPDTLQPVFSKNPAWRLILDLNHVYSNDPSMRLAAAFARAFRDRIVEFHISGFAKLHEPMYQTHKTEILSAVFDRSLPIIVESQLTSLEDARREYEYITNYFS